MDRLRQALGKGIAEPDEEIFLVFSQTIPSQNLGFVGAKATALDLTVAGKDLSIIQSPGLLSSNRKEGTTGAVLLKITPLFADWVCNPANILSQCGVLQSGSHVLELGSGISGIISLVLGPRVRQYVATDQEYVLKTLRQNIANNLEHFQSSSSSRPRKKADPKLKLMPNIVVRALDWETDSLTKLYSDIGLQGEEDIIDLIISCDCIYNESLVDPLVNTCKEICSLAPASKPTVCVIAQQLRSPDVFEKWLIAFHKYFQVWRVPDDLLIDGLKEDSGFVLHMGILRP